MTPSTIPPGARIGRYVVLHALGSGTYGAVYAARHEGLPRTFALKVLHRALTHRSDVVARFENECRALATLHHPHIVEVVDVGVADGVPYLAMELLEGETLRARIEREGALPLDAAVDLMLPLCSAVSAVHAAGFVHRDIKPDNVVLAVTRPGRVHPKLLDFGVARVRDSDRARTGTGAAIGTPYYMSPEQVEQAREADAASDQWSLAVILYRAVTGRFPFDGRSVVKILHAILEDAPPPPSACVPGVPLPVERALLRALSKDPRQRFPSVRAFGEALLPYATRRARDEWREDFVDDTAGTVDLDFDDDETRVPARRRPPTRQGPAFRPPPAAFDLFDDDDVQTRVNPQSAAPVAPPAPVAPVAPVAPALPSPPATDVQVPSSTLSFGAHSLSPIVEARRARRQVVAAGLVALASVLACAAVVVHKRRARALAGAAPYATSALAVVTRAPTPTRATEPAPAAPQDTLLTSPPLRDAGVDVAWTEARHHGRDARHGRGRRAR